MEDDEFRGYFIPADSVLVANVWCVQAVTYGALLLAADNGVEIGRVCMIPKNTEIPTYIVRTGTLGRGESTQMFETHLTSYSASAEGENLH